ncbi:GAF domain-containing protein [Leifsonia sp. McL0607]|uniref:GAF domain-containing sensor histidine kinase n=1 Tax=Leifsonia sp. McL0607 TaxID=3415672 RepID=UPI003CF3CE23
MPPAAPAAAERRHAISGDEPITFPDAPRAELDRALGELVEQARKVLETQGRLRALVRANRAVVSHLELPVVLRTIIEAAVELVGARYGALGVIAEGGGLEQFIHVGMSEDAVARIGHLPEGHGLLGALIDDPRPIRLDSIAGDARSSGFPEGHPPMTAFLGVPIAVRDTVFGNLYLTDPAAGGFTDDDEQLVKALAANAGFAIDNARLYAETVARQAWSASAAEMTASILGSDAEQAHEEFATRVAGLVGARTAFVLGTGEPNGALRLLGTNGDPAPTDVVQLDNDRVRSAIEGAQPTRLDEVNGLPLAEGWEPGPGLVVPFAGKTGEPEVLIAVRESGALPFSAFELERAVTFAGQASLAMELAEARADRERIVLLEDRARIARDLHDHVIQQLFGAGLELQSIESAVGPGPLAERIDGTVKSLDGAIARIRTAIFSLSAHDHDESLRHRLLDIVLEVGDALPQPATVSFSGPVDVVADSGLADDIAAFVREGLTNVVRHAGASTATVEVVASADEITVDVADDGTGIGETSRHSGLRNLSERAERRAGVFDVESTLQGTRLHLRLPVPMDGVT